MSNKFFLGVVGVMLVLFAGYIGVTAKNRAPQTERPGIAQADKGGEHVAEGSVKYGGPLPPTSGPMGQPLPWQVFSQEIPDMNVLHNLEHGGVYISYRPDLPADQIAKITSLFSKPYRRKGFSPIKAVVAPRAANKSPIVMTSWRRYMELNSYEEQKLVDYYLRNISKSPEPFAN